jgi:hypothetical protein
MFGIVKQLKELVAALQAISHSIDCLTAIVSAYLSDQSGSAKPTTRRTMLDSLPPPQKPVGASKP